MDSAASGRQDWRRTLVVMVLLYAVVAVGRSIAFPFLPLLFVQLGVHPLAHVEFWTGATMSVSFLLAAVFSPIWGALADRIGRKAMIVRASVALIISTGLISIAGNAPEVFGLRAAAGIFSGFSGAAMALVATQVPEERLGFSLGWMATAQLVGTLIGPLLGGVLIDAFHDYRSVFLVTSVITFVALLACLVFVHEAPFRTPGTERSARLAPFAALREMGGQRDLVPLFVVILIAQICALGAGPIVPLFVATMVPAAWLATAAGAAVAVTGLADVIASPLLGKRSDQIGYRRVLLISLVGAAVFTFPQAWAQRYWVFLALRFGVGVFIGGIVPTANAWVGRMVTRDERGRVFGLAASAQQLGMAIGPALSAVVAAHFGFRAVFETIGALMVANLIWVITASPRDVPAVREPA